MEEIIVQIKAFDKYPQLLNINLKFPHIGCHLSIANGFADITRQMKDVQATAAAFFTSSPRSWNVKFPNLQATQMFIDVCQSQEIGRNQFISHAPYLINVCSEDEIIHKKSIDRLLYDAFLTRLLGLDRINFHPGSTKNKQDGIKQISDIINQIHEIVPDIILVIETMAGSKSNTIMGDSFEEIKQIIDNVKIKSRVGVCIDTCHVFSGAFVDEKDFGKNILKQFDEVIGQQFLQGMHVNGSMTKYGSGVDRHEVLCRGYISEQILKDIIQQQRKIPYCLETPDEDQYEQEILMLMKWWKEK